MLKKRVIACLILKDNILVQSEKFSKYFPIGKLDIALEYLEKWDIDEIVILDISATLKKKVVDISLISKFVKSVFVPISIGGGINCLEQIKQIISHGADKIVLNSTAYFKPELISECANLFGRQSVIVSIDVKKTHKGDYIVMVESGKTPIKYALVEYMQKVEKLGAGELLINSIDNDGSKLGYDIELYKQIQNKVNIPIIAMGGAKDANDIKELFLNTNINAAAAANMFHFTEHSTAVTVGFLKKYFNDIRVNRDLDYSNYKFDDLKRVLI